MGRNMSTILVPETIQGPGKCSENRSVVEVNIFFHMFVSFTLLFVQMEPIGRSLDKDFGILVVMAIAFCICLIKKGTAFFDEAIFGPARMMVFDD